MITSLGCLIYEKELTFLLLNAYHAPWLDAVMTTLTMAGDGLFSAVVVVLLFAFSKRKEAVTLLLAFLTSGLVAQLMKHILDTPRPSVYLEQSKLFYDKYVQDTILHSAGSFPSGHAASAFAMATVFALFSTHKGVGIVCLVIATLIAYSRIYLAQHFLEDAVAGALIGVLFAIASYLVINNAQCSAGGRPRSATGSFQ